jgi:hypothetical protein
MQAYNRSRKRIITMKIPTIFEVTPCSLAEYLYSSTLEMEAVRSSMTSVIIYQIARFCNTGGINVRSHCHENFRSHKL